MTLEELEDWLEGIGSVDGREFRGYGHITADELAERMLRDFNISYKEGTFCPLCAGPHSDERHPDA